MPTDPETPGGPLRGSPGNATGSEPSATAAAGGEKKPAPSKKVKKALTLAALYVLMFISVASTLMLIAVAVYSSPVTAEIGGRPDLSRYETGLASKICSVDANNDLSTDRIEDKELTLVFFGFIKKNVPLHVKDTTPPTVSARKVTTVTGTILSPGDFIKSVEDKTEVSLDFTGDPPDTSAEGVSDVYISVRDGGGNVTEIATTLTVDDTGTDVSVEFGSDEQKAEKAIADAHPDLTDKDLSSVNVKECGRYIVSAYDADGNLFTFYVTVRDTTAPTAQSASFDVLLGSEFSPDSLVRDIFDLSPTKVRYGAEPDTSTPGAQTIPVTVSDPFGNKIELVSQIIVHDVPSSAVIERGTSEYEAAAVILNGDDELSLPDSFSFSSLPLGETKIDLMGKYNSVNVSVTVEDTVAPTLSLKQITVFENSSVSPADFVLYCWDFSPVTYRFEWGVATATAGDRAIGVTATDEAGNSTTSQTVLHVIKDVTAPVIYGVRDQTVIINSEIPSFSEVYAVDNADGNVAVSIDTSEVDVTSPGRYSVGFTAFDKAGNTSHRTCTLYVTDDPRTILEATADKILAQIITPGMTTTQKAWAIYSWVNTNIRYSTSTSYLMGNYVEGALSGFRIRSGNCYIYYAVSDVMLERAGIPSIEIRRNVKDRPHYWNLVYIDGYWYHFDACPHYNDYPLVSFLLTDAQVAEYSERCVDYYSFDAYLYPRTP